jgi:isopentenyl-diphosphate delta-isomerase
VVLLDGDHRPIGQLPKSQVHHTETPLHLAFSCYLFDDAGQVLMTRRAISKQTWPGVWTNTCCGHPLPGESLEAAAGRRLAEELGLRLIHSEVVLPDFRYRAVAPDGIVENEFCPVLVGRAEGDPHPDPTEVIDHHWSPWPRIVQLATHTPYLISPWSARQIPLLATHLDLPHSAGSAGL